MKGKQPGTPGKQAAEAIAAIASRIGAVEQASTEISSIVASHSGLLQNLGETIARISEVTRGGVEAMTAIVEASVMASCQAPSPTAPSP